MSVIQQGSGNSKQVQLRLLGCPQLALAGQTQPCAPYGLRLLAVLALGGPQPRLNVADLLWEGESRRILHNLRMALLKLRRTLGTCAGVLQDAGGSLSLDLERVWVDILEKGGSGAEFMAGHRTHGSEGWLTWAAEQQERLASTEEYGNLSPCRQPFQNLDEAHGLAAQARQAIEQDQFALAQNYVRQALRGLKQPPAEIFYTAAYVADFFGHSQWAEKQALAGLARLSGQMSPAPYYAIIASSYDTRGDHQTARLWHELALQAARHSKQPEEFCEVVSFLVWHLNVTGEALRTRALAAEALSLGDFCTTTPYIRNSLGIAETLLGRPEQAFDSFAPQHQHEVTSLSIISQVRSGRIYTEIGQHDRAAALLERTLPVVQRTEDGRARYEWAAAALLTDPARWQAQAQACVQGIVTNDPNIVVEYQRLRTRWQNQQN